MERTVRSLEDLSDLAAELVPHLEAGSIVLLDGPLGVGKTAFVKAALACLGFKGLVRSPTFNLLQTFDTNPPVLHADLYRLKGASGLGLEDYFQTHLCIIEWPDRLDGMVDSDECWRVTMAFSADESRRVLICHPRENDYARTTS